MIFHFHFVLNEQNKRNIYYIMRYSDNLADVGLCHTKNSNGPCLCSQDPEQNTLFMAVDCCDKAGGEEVQSWL